MAIATAPSAPCFLEYAAASAWARFGPAGAASVHAEAEANVAVDVDDVKVEGPPETPTIEDPAEAEPTQVVPLQDEARARENALRNELELQYLRNKTGPPRKRHTQRTQKRLPSRKRSVKRPS